VTDATSRSSIGTAPTGASSSGVLAEQAPIDQEKKEVRFADL
jgi:hypothetical protein